MPFDELWQSVLQIKVKDPSDKETIQAIKADLEDATGVQFIVVNTSDHEAGDVDDDDNDSS